MSIDATGRFAFVANYIGGSIAVLPILPDGGWNPPALSTKITDRWDRNMQRPPRPGASRSAAMMRLMRT